MKKNGTKIILFVAVGLLFLLLFWPILFQGEIFAFRDDAYFYHHLFRYIQEYWDAGQLPLWDPCDNLGQPLAAIPTSTVWYPVKVLFFLPRFLPISYITCYKWYILVHILWAFFTLYWLAVHWKISRIGSVLAGMSYAFGAGVVFQYCNVIFLIGAAWLPLTIYYGDRLLCQERLVGVLGLSFSLAMMVLGGDPQMAYMSGLPLMGLFFLRWWSEIYLPRNQLSHQENVRSSRPASVLMTLLLLGSAVLLAGGLAAIQIIPTKEVIQASDRSNLTYPLSVWDIPKYLKNRSTKDTQDVGDYFRRENPQAELMQTIQNTHSGGIYDHPDDDQESETSLDHFVPSSHQIKEEILNGLLCKTLDRQDHSLTCYNFSIPPWQYAGMIWPNLGGKFVHHNTRWFAALPNDHPWTLSLYMGLIPCLLFLSVFRLFQKRSNRATKMNISPVPLNQNRRLIRQWASWLALLAILATLGGLGCGWLLRAFLHIFGSGTSLKFANGDPVGGIYWMLNVFLPGFASFRYPAKLFPLAAVGIAILVGIGYDCGRRSRMLRQNIDLFLILSMISLIFLVWQGKDFFYFPAVEVTNFFGPYMPEIAWKETVGSFLYTGALLIGCRLIFFNRSLRLAIPCLVIMVSVADIWLCNRHSIMTCPEMVFTSKTYFDEMLIERDQTRKSQDYPPLRILKVHSTPKYFENNTSAERFTERTFYDRNTFNSKYHYCFHFGNIDSRGTVFIDSYAPFINWLTIVAKDRDVTPYLNFLDVRCQVYPKAVNRTSPWLEQLTLPEESTSGLASNLKAILDETDFLATIPPTSRFKIYHHRPELDDPQQTLVDMVLLPIPENPLDSERVEFIHYSPNRLEWKTTLQEQGDLVLAEQYVDGWKATVFNLDDQKDIGRPLEIKKTLQCLRRVTLPAGNHRVVMEYRPASFYRGLTISLLAWGVFITLWWIQTRHPSSQEISRTGNTLVK